MDSDATLRLKVRIPMFTKGQRFYFSFDDAHVYAFEGGVEMGMPLRAGLAGYLRLLRYDQDKYFEVDEGWR